MIFVDRSAVPVPAFLESSRAIEARKLITQVMDEASNAHLKQLSFRFQPRIWVEAKPALFKLFHNKCAYCEGQDASGFLEVEHFRPKANASDLSGIKNGHLYYSWLAYDWENLLLVCRACNQIRKQGDHIIGKGARFPVKGARAHLGSDVKECRIFEKETLLDPCFDNPREHLTFNENGLCEPLTSRGELSIAVIGLNRPALVKERQRALLLLDHALRVFPGEVKDVQPSAVREHIEQIADLAAPDQPYAGAIRAVLEKRLSPDGVVRTPLPDFSRDTISKALAKAGRNVRVGRLPVLSKPTFPKETVPELIESPRQINGRKELPPNAQRWLSRIELSNFKSIRSLVIDLAELPSEEGDKTPCLMLVGENAAGKSSILEAVALALMGTDQIRALGLDGTSYLRRNKAWKTVLQPTVIKLSFVGDKKPSVVLKIDPKSGEFIGPDKEQVVILGYGPRRFFSNEKGNRRRSGTAARISTLFDPTAIIANPSGWLLNANEGDFDTAIRALRQLLLMDERSFVTRPARGQRIGKEVMFELQGSVMPLERLSEGYRTVVATAVDIIRELLEYWPDLSIARGVVLIDELDTHLHPRWKMRILERLRNALPGVQFISTTHDPLCLRGLFNGEVQVLHRTEGSTVERVQDLPNVQGLTVEQLLTSDYFGLLSTQDPSVEEGMIRYVALASKEVRTPEEEAELNQHRIEARKTLRLGRSPQEQLIYEAANEFLLQERNRIARTVRTSKTETKRRMLEIWGGVRTKPSKS